MPETHQRDRWDKLSILLQPLGGLLAALAIAFIGIYSSAKIENAKDKETRARLYIELMSRREEAESALRKDMFASIMNSFLGSERDTPETRLLKLELLTYNFHESLNLKPLFMELKRQISNEMIGETQRRKEGLDRLHRAAREIGKKQTASLKGGGAAFSKTIIFDGSGRVNPSVVYEDTLTLDGITRKFSVRVLSNYLEDRELDVFLTVNSVRDSMHSLAQNNGRMENISASFNVGFFDFPMIDNIRLSNDQRCAVVLRDFKNTSAEITLIYFPGSHASLKEKPYVQEVLDKLREEELAP
jgi:hypothetical protein